MRIFNYEIHKVEQEPDLKDVILNKAEQNAKQGLITANLELRHHTLLLEQLEIKLPPSEEKKEELEREIRLTKEAIERDEKTINNYQTQLRAIEKERGSNVTAVYFTNNPKEHEEGDTITISLSNGTRALYELTKII